MVAENPTWGAPRIHGELLMLGFDDPERTISRWMKRAPRDPRPAKRWRLFENHREALEAMDFFTVPTITFGVLYCFFVIGHDRRRILHFNVTKHPTSGWIIQQLREAFPLGAAPRFLIHDRDAKYGTEVPAAIRSLKINGVRSSFESPWQNGVAERWVGSCRRELLDHAIALNERHLKRLLSEYMSYYHEDRTHLGLGEERGGRTLLGDTWLRASDDRLRRAAAPLRSSCLIRGFSVHPYICVRQAEARCIGVRRRRQKSPAHSRKEWLIQCGARRTRSLHWAKETTLTSDDILATHSRFRCSLAKTQR